MALSASTQSGNPLPYFAEVASNLGMSRDEQAAFLNLSRSTYFRHLKATSVDAGTAALAEFLPFAYEHLIELFGDEEDVRNWLLRPNLTLGRKRPLDLLRSLEGYERVLETAKRGVYGVY